MPPCLVVYREPMVQCSGKDFKPLHAATAQEQRTVGVGGAVLIQVDDLLIGGLGIEISKKMQKIQERFSPRNYIGRSIVHPRIDEVRVSVEEQVQGILPIEKIPSTSEEANADEKRAFRSLIGSMLWCARSGAPQVQADTTLLSVQVTDLKGKDMRET
eukprot:2125565-Amphidinium_carterae.1